LIGCSSKPTKPHRLLLELPARQGIPWIALRHIHSRAEHPPVRRLDVDFPDPSPWVLGVHLRVQGHPHTPANRRHALVVECMMLEVVQARASANGDESQHS